MKVLVFYWMIILNQIKIKKLEIMPNVNYAYLVFILNKERILRGGGGPQMCVYLYACLG